MIHAGVFGAWFAPLARRLPGRVVRLVRDGFTTEAPAAGRWTAPDLSGVAAPTLLVAGSASPLATHRLVSRLAGRLPDARVATVEGANHLLPLTHPSEVADLVTSGRIVAAG